MQRLLFSALLVVFVVGCGNRMESQVSGIVTLDGETIGPGVVNFSPIDGKSNPAIGTILPDGSYSLKTNRTDGLLAGRYRVAVTVFQQSPESQAGERSMAPTKLLTPERYNSADTSALEFEVKPGNNTIDIALSSK
jgi:hypothetical protein